MGLIVLFLSLLLHGAASITHPQTTTPQTEAQEDFISGVGLQSTNLKDIIKDGKLVVKLGHIGAMGMMRILGISRKSLHYEGILGENLDIEIISQNGCGDSYEGVAVAADMYHLQKVKAFIGPYCNAEIDAVARIAAYWNLPIIGYMAASNALADKRAYKTLTRISTRSTNSIAEATCALLKHYRWNKVAIVTNVGAVAYDRTVAFEEVFHSRGVIFDEYADGAMMRASGLIQEVRNTARDRDEGRCTNSMIIFLFSNTREQSKELMLAAQGEGMLASEFVFILPWLQFISRHWGRQNTVKGQTGGVPSHVPSHKNEMEKEENDFAIDKTTELEDGGKEASPWIRADGKHQYDNAIIIDDVNGFDNSIVLPFLERLKEDGLTEQDIDVANIYGYIYLFDSLKLYALAARKVLNETGNPSAVLDGFRVWSAMRRMVFPGIVGKSGIVSGIITMDDRSERAPLYRGFFISPNQDQVVTDIMTNFWPSLDGRMLLDEPICGFRGEKCDYTLIVIAAILAVVLLGMLASAYFIHRHMEKRALDKLPFRLFRDDVQLIDEEQMKGAVHDNANPFLGICFNEKEELFLVWKFCNRGTLQDIIYNDQIQMDTKFHGALIKDIIGGLEYLHASPIGYHGSLTPWSCLIDRNWMIKLADYGVAEPIERWEKQQWITVDDLKDDEDKCNAKQKTSALYDAPEMLKMRGEE
ncbi:hypothetical protein PRIPAC_78211 [Pristionchus pacificus]|uniref:guanylate cyclase n=1 Tax=Pristionchus pacificus TaxID=54126 RepID=A0A2A6C4A7_PRIPA|nr:hypothetical protein PRIPAC_78211 [Pristionchus pacificus]|eukprot:PDM72994.1 protein kinase [Pristionchus pacificus]